MELRPFRSLRYAPRVLNERGLGSLLSPHVAHLPANATDGTLVPENVLRLLKPSEGDDRAAAAAATLTSWISSGILMRERRPGLWVYRAAADRRTAAPMLVGLVRLARAPVAPTTSPTADSRSVEDLLALRRALRADLEPSLLSTRAPLSSALATTRQPDLSAEDRFGVRHDAWRLSDFAQHVELQGLVKNAEAVLEEGSELWEAAHRFEQDPDSAKLPGARFKLCAIYEQSGSRDRRGVAPPALGLFGVSLEDPVY